MTRLSTARIVGIALIAALALASGGCSSGDREEGQAKAEPKHVWKDQTDMLDRARDLEGQILDQAQRRQEEIDAQAR